MSVASVVSLTPDMMGSIEAFMELNRSISGKVRFPNGLVVDIHGRGIVVFIDNGRNHRAFMDVYFILTLKSSFVSLGQLDEGLFDIAIRRGVLTIRHQRSRLFIEVN